MSDVRPKRVQRFGPEQWDQRGGREWSLWDLWFCVIAAADHAGDLDALATQFVDTIRSPGSFGRRDQEAKLSHVCDLQRRLGDAGLDTAELVDAHVLADKKVLRRAREKVVGRVGIEGRSQTAAMGLAARIRHGRTTHTVALFDVDVSPADDPKLVVFLAAYRQWCAR